MNSTLLFAVLAATCAVAPLATAQKKPKLAPGGIEVGRIAPPLGELGWVPMGGASGPTDLATLRGSVVIVADYGYYCDSCVRVGVPTLNALRASNDPSELRVLHLTAAVGDDTPDTIRQEGEKLGLAGPLAVVDVEGEMSPYLDMDANGNLTWATVIGRHGGVVWKGDPSREREAYVAAVSDALHAVPCEPLPAKPDAFGEAIAPAVREYVRGDFVKAQALATTMIEKLGTKPGDEAERARADAKALLALVEGTRKRLMDELEISGGEKHAQRFQRSLSRVRRVFAKGPEADRAGSLEMYVTIQSDQGPACRKWAEWYELEARRPATFPALADAPGTKYARELSKYVKQEGVPELERAKAWLAEFETVRKRK